MLRRHLHLAKDFILLHVPSGKTVIILNLKFEGKRGVITLSSDGVFLFILGTAGCLPIKESPFRADSTAACAIVASNPLPLHPALWLLTFPYLPLSLHQHRTKKEKPINKDIISLACHCILTHLERQGTRMINPTQKFSFRQQWHGMACALDLNPLTSHKHAYAKSGAEINQACAALRR